jgi:hypothetical protein
MPKRLTDNLHEFGWASALLDSNSGSLAASVLEIARCLGKSLSCTATFLLLLS